MFIDIDEMHKRTIYYYFGTAFYKTMSRTNIAEGATGLDTQKRPSAIDELVSYVKGGLIHNDV